MKHTAIFTCNFQEYYAEVDFLISQQLRDSKILRYSIDEVTSNLRYFCYLQQIHFIVSIYLHTHTYSHAFAYKLSLLKYISLIFD